MTRRAKKRLLFLSAGTIAIGALMFGGHRLHEYRRAESAAKAHVAGLEAFERGDFESALVDLGHAVARGYDDCDTMLALVECRLRFPLENEQHLFRGVTILRQASAKHPSRPEPYEKIIDLYGRLGFLTERLDAAEALLELQPHSFIGHQTSIEVLVGLGRYEDAIAAADLFLEHEPTSADALELRVAAMEFAGATIEACCQFVSDVAGTYPESLNVAIVQAETLLRASRRDEARSALERALDLRTQDTDILARLVSIMDLLGLDERADELLASLASSSSSSLGESPVVASLLLDRAWKRRQFGWALDFIETRPESVAVRNDELLGWSAFILVTDGEDAGDEIAELTSRETDAARYWGAIIEGHQRWSMNDDRSAYESFTTASAYRPDEPIALYFLARLDRRLGELVRAAYRLESVVDVDPTWLDAQVSLATTYLANGRYQEAVVAAGRAIALHPRAGHALLLAEVYADCAGAGIESDRLGDESLRVIEQLRDLLPDNVELLAVHARILAITGDMTEARGLIDEILSHPAGIAPTRLAAVAEAVRRHDRVLAERIEAVVFDSPHHDPSLVRLAAARVANRGDLDAARARYDVAIQSATDPLVAFELQLDREVFLDLFGDPEAYHRLLAVAASNPENTRGARAVLGSRSAWEDEPTIIDAIERLRHATGETATDWVIFDARRRLAFDEDEARASEVIEVLTPLLKADPLNPEGLALMAQAYLRLGDRDSAIELLTLAVDAHPQRLDLHPQLIELLRLAGRVADLDRRLWEYAARPIPAMDASTIRTRLHVMVRHQMWDEAEEDIERLGPPMTVEDHLNFASVHAARGRYDAARHIYAGQLAAQTSDPRVAMAAAELEAIAGTVDAGLLILDVFCSTHPEHELRQITPAYLERHGHVDEARTRFMSLAESGAPEDVHACVQFLMRHDSLDDAASLLSRVIDEHPGIEMFPSLLTLVEVIRGDTLATEDMVQIAQTLIAESDRDAFGRLVEAEARLRARPGDITPYIFELREIVDEHPTVEGAWMMLVDALLQHGKAEDAMSSAHASVRANPRSIKLARLLTTTLIRHRRFEEARAAARQWKRMIIHDTLDVDVALSIAELETGAPDVALSLLSPHQQQITQNADADPELLMLLLRSMLSVGEAGAAHELVAGLPFDASWNWRLPSLAVCIADIDASRDWLEFVEGRDHSGDRMREALVVAWYELGDRTNDDPSCYEQVVMLAPIDERLTPRVQAIAADSERILGRPTEAIRRYRALIDADPEDAIARNNLAFILLSEDQDLPEASTHARLAVEIAQRQRMPASYHATFLDTLGAICLARGDAGEAVDALKEAQEMSPLDPSLDLRLIEALVSAERIEQADIRLRRFLSVYDLTQLSPNDADWLDRLSARVRAG